jgi:hypothetical protein
VKVREKPIPCPVHTTCDNGDCSIGHCVAEIELRAERLAFNRWRPAGEKNHGRQTKPCQSSRGIDYSAPTTLGCDP